MGCVIGRIRVEYKELQKLQLCCDEYALDVNMRDQREPAEGGCCAARVRGPKQSLDTENNHNLSRDTDMVPWCLHCNIEMVSTTSIQSVPVFNGI